MFDTIQNARIASNAALLVFEETKTVDDYPVKVVFHADVSDEHHDKWRTVLDKWMPQFEEHGWLEDLLCLQIGDELIVRSGVAGEYRSGSCLAVLGDDPVPTENPKLYSTGREYSLLHEMSHHAHMNTSHGDLPRDPNEIDVADLVIESGWYSMGHKFAKQVSAYATEDPLETVAETAASIALGNEVDDDIMETYYALGGPEPIEP